MEKNKRKRSENWDSYEKILLRQLIEDKICIVENKNVDTNTSKLKREAWKEITNTFNKMNATNRDTAQLKAHWRCTKMKAKASASAYKRNINATGGGPPPKSPDPYDEKLMALIPHEFEVDFNEYDCDTSDLLVPKENVSGQADIDVSTSFDQPSVKSPLIEIETEEDSFEKLEFLEDDDDIENSTPILTSSSKKKSSKQIGNSKDDALKQELFEMAIETRRLENKYMKEEHEEKIKTIIMERTEKLKTLEMERMERLKTLEMERAQKLQTFQILRTEQIKAIQIGRQHIKSRNQE